MDALRLAGVGEDMSQRSLDTPKAAFTDIRCEGQGRAFRHRLAEAIASVAYTGLDLSHLMKDREPEGRQQQGQE